MQLLIYQNRHTHNFNLYLNWNDIQHVDDNFSFEIS